MFHKHNLVHKETAWHPIYSKPETVSLSIYYSTHTSTRVSKKVQREYFERFQIVLAFTRFFFLVLKTVSSLILSAAPA